MPPYDLIYEKGGAMRVLFLAGMSLARAAGKVYEDAQTMASWTSDKLTS
jgi:hypothetical protein